MDEFKFRPVLDGLEEKLVPAVMPSDVFMAMRVAGFTTEALKDIVATAGEPRTSQEIQATATYLRALGDASRADVPILDGYRRALIADISANPAQASILDPYLRAATLAEFESVVNAAYCDVYSVGFGAPPRVPPSPPPPPPPGASTSLPGNPVGSTLPFSLGDPSWQALSSGVRIWDVTQGTGAAVKQGDQITVSYVGYLANGTIFDSSAKAGKNFSTTLSTANLIPGFVYGVEGMKVGGERRVDIPASLGYGANGSGSSVPPNAELVFDITLVSSP